MFCDLIAVHTPHRAQYSFEELTRLRHDMIAKECFPT